MLSGFLRFVLYAIDLSALSGENGGVTGKKSFG
jgi:hypothetical protein